MMGMLQCADCVGQTTKTPTACFDCIQQMLGPLLTTCCPCLYYVAAKMGTEAVDLQIDC